MPIDAILFGGRRKTTVPLVYESRDWAHGVFIGATLSSETTAAATGAVGVVRRDPMAMLPFIGYNAGDYVNHWLEIGKAARRVQAAEDLPGQLVPQRRRGRLLPVARLRRQRPRAQVGRGAPRRHRAGRRDPGRPRAASGAIDTTGLDMTDEQVAKALAVNVDEWRDQELPLIEEWFAKFGDKLPTQLADELATLKTRLESA